MPMPVTVTWRLSREGHWHGPDHSSLRGRVQVESAAGAPWPRRPPAPAAGPPAASSALPRPRPSLLGF
eukprot:3078575-Rhodomonas_salina.1